MKKYKTFLYAIVICLIGILIGLAGMHLYHSWKFERMYKSLLKKEVDVLFLGRPTCEFCNLLKPIVDDMSEKYQIEYRYINTDWLTKKELEKILNRLNIDSKKFSTPRIIITKKDKIKDAHIGYMDDISLFYYFQRNGLIDKKEVFQDPYPNVKRLSSEEYFEILEKKETAQILVGRIGDKNTNDILTEASNQKRGLYYLNPSVFVTKEEYQKFIDSLVGLREDDLLPLLIEIENGNVVTIMDYVLKANLQNLK